MWLSMLEEDAGKLTTFLQRFGDSKLFSLAIHSTKDWSIVSGHLEGQSKDVPPPPERRGPDEGIAVTWCQNQYHRANVHIDWIMKRAFDEWGLCWISVRFMLTQTASLYRGSGSTASCGPKLLDLRRPMVYLFATMSGNGLKVGHTNLTFDGLAMVNHSFLDLFKSMELESFRELCAVAQRVRIDVLPYHYKGDQRNMEGVVWSLGTKGCLWRPGSNEFFVAAFDVAREAAWQTADYLDLLDTAINYEGQLHG
ncbi:hypothetical protein C8R44DRAFT_732814 [Mycena epipterygia]|nr:hypothetical protein C8R44DRAFT_732814 [Mycena epipterygia]